MEEVVFQLVITALADVGEAAHESIPLLQRFLAKRPANMPSRVTAIVALGSIDPRGDIAVPSIVEALTKGKDNSAIRFAAAYTLGKIGGPAPEVIAALESALQDNDEQVRRYAAKALVWVTAHALGWP